MLILWLYYSFLTKLYFFAYSQPKRDKEILFVLEK